MDTNLNWKETDFEDHNMDIVLASLYIYFKKLDISKLYNIIIDLPKTTIFLEYWKKIDKVNRKIILDALENYFYECEVADEVSLVSELYRNLEN
jgi:hypothetical protein